MLIFYKFVWKICGRKKSPKTQYTVIGYHYYRDAAFVFCLFLHLIPIKNIIIGFF